ncbi:MAG: hypothetical protein QNJ69_13555 [Gammaproteobacteria bacterium]|nr:hypothetical protein [Gammaproteobacteria bacterium]
MTSLHNDIPAQRYNLKISARLLYLEILSFFGLLLCLFFLLPVVWLLPVVVLYALLGIQFFTHRSVIRRYSDQPAIELRMKPGPLICYHHQGETCFSEEQISLKISRWFVLVKLRNASQQFDHILMADSFTKPEHYNQFRRQLLEIFDVS